MCFLQQLRILMTPQDKLRFLLVAAVMFLAAMMELAGIGVLLPVVAVFLNPAWMEHELIRQFCSITGISGKQQLVLAGVGMLIAVFTVKTAVSLLAVRMQARFIFGKQRELATRLYGNYLKMPFRDGQNRTVSEWDAMLQLIDQLCNYVLMCL